MPFFRFKMLSPQGRMEHGTVDLPFDDPIAAMRYLERRGGVALQVRVLPSILWGPLGFVTRLNTVPRPEVAEFFNNMSMLTKAGVPILTSLEEIESDTRHKVLRKTLQRMITDIQSGQTFAEAISRHPHIFAPVLIQMVMIGEETGNLDDMLEKCSEHVRHIHEIISSTKKAMMYPSFLIFVVTGAVIFWFAFVVPQIVKLFYELNVALPFATRLIIAISDWFQNWFALTAGTLVGLVVLAVLLRKWSRKVRYWEDYLLLNVPIIGKIVQTASIARICEYLGLLISAGIGVIRTLEIITASTRNTVYVHKLEQVRESITMGSTLTQALKTHEALHPFALRMILVGEQSGKLDEQTAYVAEVYRGRLKDLVDTLGKSLEPIMLIVVGGLFALIMAGLLLPIYDLIGKVGG